MIDFKKIHIKDEYIFLSLGAAIIAIGVFGLSDYSFKQVAQEDKVDTFEESIPLQCEQGSWIEFPDLKDASQRQLFSGKEKMQYDTKANSFKSADGARLFTLDEKYSLAFFIDRDTQVEGYALKENEVFVKRIKCIGVEANQDVLQSRRNLMNYIKNNINTLALEKSSNGDWQVETFYFVNDTDVYVQYETEGSFMEEAPYDSHLWLIRVSNLANSIPTIETLAYIQEDAEDAGGNIVKQGNDIYKDTKNMTIYEFDEDAQQWILQ